ncbi:MAG: type III-B CRISPR module RAMP protein Cmr1 [Saprospiraceae bacterium]
MESITFTCETITPMFLAGADGQTPELRAPSIKGALRFWWRAMHGHLDLKKLHDLEGKIFGDNSHRSCFTIRIQNRNQIDFKTKPVPHKNYPLPAIKQGSTFDVVLSIQETPDFTANHLSALFELIVVLGGFGKRTRRAMGGVKITSKKLNDKEVAVSELTIDYIAILIGNFNKHFQKHQNSLINTFQGTMQKYPWIKQIEIGEDKRRDVPSQTSDTTHTLKGKYRQAYEPNLGHAFKGRFASPIIVSVIGNSNTPVITTLNTVPDRGHRDLDNFIQEDFKKNIL